MDGATVGKLSRNMGIPVDRILHLLREAGLDVASRHDLVTGKQQLLLLKRLNTDEGTSHDAASLEALRQAASLQEFDDLLTQAMAKRQIQALIKGENLDRIVKWILELSRKEGEELRAAAMLGRLAAVVRGDRESNVHAGIAALFSGEPQSIETLRDGEAKAYAALALSRINEPWLPEYAVREAVLIDRADDARRELLKDRLRREGTIADWISAISGQANCLRRIGNPDTRVRRIRRLFFAVDMVAQQWRGDVGSDVGVRLAEFLRAFVAPMNLADLDQAVLFESTDSIVSVLTRVIELRFSTALYDVSYRLLVQAKMTFGPGIWGRYVRESRTLPALRTSLLEASLVLGRQNRTDEQMLAILTSVYASRRQASAAIRQHFKKGQDLEPNIAEWWTSVGDVALSTGTTEHRIGNSEDAEIGVLLIEIERNRDATEKIRRAVVPLLEISDQILAATVKRAVGGQMSMEQTVRRLGRMRRLTLTNLVGEYVEYNPLEHELVGGHRPGVRRVKVVRDGVRKDFGGHIRTLVKPWVETDRE